MSGLNAFQRAKGWLVGNKEKLLVLVGLLLVGMLSYEAGILRGALRQSEPLVLSLPATANAEITPQDTVSGGNQVLGGVEQIASKSGEPSVPGSCLYVGSRNSNKYHIPTCSFAKRIKPENKVCFASKEDAEKRGYVAGCLK